MEYRPLITREVYQLSLWRVDGYTCVKTKFAYFTPKSRFFEKETANMYEINFSLDGEHIIVSQKPEDQEERMENKLIIIIDAFSFDVVREKVIRLRLFNLPDYELNYRAIDKKIDHPHAEFVTYTSCQPF
jgi:hypothetical protein